MVGYSVVRVLLLALGVVVAVSFLPIEASQPSTFADPAFARYFHRTGTDGQALLWGGGPIVSLVEPFTGAPGSRRLVEYFDRGRMELIVDGEGRDVQVTEGLLVKEMATGNVQLGYDSFVQVAPADIPLIGATGLTYADFRDATSRAPDRTASADNRVDAWIAVGGAVSAGAAPVTVRASQYVSETGHNVPDVFVAWFASRPFGNVDALDALGYPITDAFWVESGKGNAGASLVQLFERRVVTYTPGLPTGEQFTLTNAGRHYYRWRYGSDPGAAQQSAATNGQRSVVLPANDDAGLTLPEGYRAASLLNGLQGVIDLAVSPEGRIALLASSGSVTLVNPASPSASDNQPFIDHLANPVALAYAGTDLYVVDDTGLHRYRDSNADGKVDAQEDVIQTGFARDSVVLAPGLDGALYISGVPNGNATQPAETTTRLLQRVNADGTVETLPPFTIERGGSVVVDGNGSLWLVDSARQLDTVNVASGTRESRLDASSLGAKARIADLLLYRRDGTNGTPGNDLIALVTSGDAGRIVRLQPSQSDATPSSTPETGTRPGAIVDFITGFERPAAMASGFDGSLYVLDTGKETLFLIQPTE
jgi:hypothetical protein